VDPGFFRGRGGKEVRKRKASSQERGRSGPLDEGRMPEKKLFKEEKSWHW